MTRELAAAGGGLIETGWHELVESIWAKLQETLPYMSPLWWEIPAGLLVCALLTWAAFYFTPLRGFAGVVTVAIISLLTGEWRGERRRAASDAAEIARLKQQRKQTSGDDWRWPWDRKDG